MSSVTTVFDTSVNGAENPYGDVRIDFDAAREAGASAEKPKDPFTLKAEELSVNFEAVAFRELCKKAISEGMISMDDFEENFGESIIPRNICKTDKPWRIPGAAKVRKILKHFAEEIDPSTAPGKPLPRTHAASKPSAVKKEAYTRPRL